MKFNSVCASLALAGFASSAALNQKRALEVVTITDVVWDVVTVTEYDQTTSTVVAEAAAGTPKAVTLTTTQTAQSPVATTAQVSSSAAAVVASPVQASSSAAAAVPHDAGTTVAVAPTTTAVVAGNVAPVSTTTQQAVAAPVTTQQAAPAAAATTAASSGSSAYSGDATYYELGLTACGQTYADTDYVAAISYKLFDQGGTANPNNNPHCGKKITVLRNGKSVDVTIVDRCAGCEGTYDVDLSPVAFNTIATASEGRVPMSWNYV